MASGKRKSQNGTADDDLRLDSTGGEENSGLAESNAMLQSRLDDAKQNRGLKEKYANRAWWFLWVYFIFVVAVVFLYGFEICGFYLPTFALTTLAGSTAIAAIGLVYVILQGLFGTRSDNDDQ